MDDNEPPTKKLKQESDGPNKKVTDIELLATADDVDGSSFFEMQVRTLLREVTFAKKKCHLIDSYINSLADYLKSLKTTKIKEGTLKHMSDLFSDCHDKFHFEAPSDVNVIGSYSVKTTVKPNLNVDISLTLTKKCMRNRSGCDNYNYDMCRAAYLSHLATELQNSDLVSDINISYHHGNHLRPILNVTPNNLKLKSVHIRLHTTVSEDFYNHEELSLSHNNLKHVCKSLQREAGSKKILGGSVIYNSHMMYDLLQREHHRVITAVLSEHKSLCDAVTLLKLWAQLRQLSQDCGGFTGFISTMFMIYLLKGKKVQTFQSPYQMFKVALKELVRINFHDGISLAHVMNVTVDESLHRKKFAEKFDFVFVDSTGLMNLMASVNELTIQLVKSEAQKCLDFMDNPHCNSFDCMFLKKHNFYHKFDQIIRIRHLQHIENSVKKKKLDVVTQADYSFNRLYMCLSLMLKIVKKALNDRVVLYSIQHNAKRQWSPTECAPSAFEGHIDLGLVVNPDKAFNALDRGPSADQPEAEQFRSFWGEVSNLRRFPDTTICEAVFWRAPTLTEKRGVILRILQHILDRHFSLNPEHIVAVHASIEELLYPAPCLLKIGVPDGTGEERHIDIEKEFNDLCQRLNGLKDFPLNIDDIRGVEPVFRNAEVCPPVAAQVFQGLRSKDNACFPGETELAPPYVPAMKVQLYLESSSAWPDEISALLHTKAAFYIQLGNLLQKQYTANVIVTENYVDIVQTFYVFRLVLVCPTEVKVRTTLKSPDGVTRTVKSASSVELSFYNTVHHKICGALANVQHINSSYNGAVRLALRWVSSHMLSDHLPNIAIELIVAHLYFQHQPYPLPSSPFGGFVRFLHFLTSHDWNLHPLIVNFYNNMDNADIADIIKDFASHRAELPIMFIATEYNKTDSFYTRHHPTPMNLQRLVQLAFKSITALELLVTTDAIKSKNFMSIFNTDTSCYDVIITLNTKQLARQFESLQPTDDSVITKQYKLLDDNKTLGVMPVVDYDPVQCYLNELREAFDNVALFFYDKHGGQCIGVLWKPELANQIFSESRATNHEPDLDGDDFGEVTTISANIPAIIEDFKLIGLGIVDSVVVK